MIVFFRILVIGTIICFNVVNGNVDLSTNQPTRSSALYDSTTPSTSIEKSSTKQVTCEETGKYLFIRPSQSAGGTCMDFPEVRVEELAEAISTICTSMKKIQEADGYVYSC